MLDKGIHFFIVFYYVFAWQGLVAMFSQSAAGSKYAATLADCGCRFLTNWNFGFQSVYFLVRLAMDFPMTRLSPGFKKLLETVMYHAFYSVIAPLTFFVGGAFWIIFNVDREMIFPKAIDAILPPVLNHVLHTIIILLVIAEMLIQRRPSPPKKSASIFFMGILFIYGISLYVTYFEKGVWIYPIFSKIQEPFRILLLLTFFAASYGFFLLSRSLNDFIVSHSVKSVRHRE